jgi:branched-chain amino acid transport system substrate-binding protein
VQIRRNVLAVVVAVALAFALSACGSNSSSHSATGASTAPKVTGASFNLGAICSCSGVQAASLAGLKEISNVWAESVNAAGGINGHPVKLTVMDDGGNPATAVQDVKQLVPVRSHSGVGQRRESR